MKIGFVGPFDSSNFGDYAMLVNNIYSLGQHEYLLFAHDEEIINTIQERYFKQYHISKVVLHTAKFDEAACESQIDEKDPYPYTPLEVVDYLTNRIEVYNQLQNIEVLVVNGGGYFNHPWNKKHRKKYLFAMMSTILLANELRKKIVFTGNTFGPFGNNAPFFAQFFCSLNQVTFASRDDIFSPMALRQLGVNKPITIIPDDLYFLNKQLCKDYSYNQFALPANFLVLEINEHTACIADHYPNLKQFVKRMKEQYGLETVLLPSHEGWGGENQCKEIAKNVPGVSLIPFVETNPKYRSIEEVRSVLRKAKLIICQKYHLFVFGIANNIPSVFGLKEIYGDKTYCYTKSAGVLKAVFSNQHYSETNFIATDIWRALNRAVMEADTIIKNQTSLFNNKKKEAEEKLHQARIRYFNNQILSQEEG